MWENPSGGAPHKQRQQTLKRDHYQCVKCGNTKNLEVDHIKNVASGGGHNLDNLQTLCKKCHKQKTRGEMRAGHQGRKNRGSYPVEPHPGLVKKQLLKNNLFEMIFKKAGGFPLPQASSSAGGQCC